MKTKSIIVTVLLSLMTYSQLMAQSITANSIQQILTSHLKYKPGKQFLSAAFPSEVQLGMNGVSIINSVDPEKRFIYTIIAAIEAAGALRPNTISQNCLMQLGRYYPGSVSLQALWSRLERYGYVEKLKEQEANCSGDEGVISYEAYHNVSEHFAKTQVRWIPLLSINETLYTQNRSLSEVLAEVKKSLSKGFRVTFNFVEPEKFAKGTLYTPNDTLIMTNQLERKLAGEPISLSMRAAVITGYNDNALLVDLDGEIHQGVLTLQSFDDAEQESFYMSYDYFLMMTIEAQRIVTF